MQSSSIRRIRAELGLLHFILIVLDRVYFSCAELGTTEERRT